VRVDSLSAAGFALAFVLLVGCANQTPVIPQLHVEPNAAARIMYFDKRANALIAERMPPKTEVPSDGDCIASEAPAPRTWGGPDAVDESGAADAESSAEEPCGEAP
jgi:hypothetical protein